jgi:uncharacterized membrane protein
VTRTRLEAFSDGVIAILITIMVLELRINNKETDWHALNAEFWKSFAAYSMSFVFLGIYWVNHHHFLHAVDRVNGAILWANVNLLFWLSLVPATTAWWGQNLTQPWPTAVYGFSLFMPAMAWTLLSVAIIRSQGPNSKLKTIIGKDLKGKLSGLFYALSVPLAFVHPLISDAIFVGLGLVWVIPDRRVERHLK